ncbi:MAG: 1,2-phenylacetyl-CoA epoxidase subunit PaaD [Anaerolineales bacterium]
MSGPSVGASERERQIWQALRGVMDPEIPVVSVVDLGVIRDVELGSTGAHITMTPTFAGCPALEVMVRQVRATVQSFGIESVEVEIVHDPPWSTDWLSEDTKARLRAFGLSPPPEHGGNIDLVLDEPAVCPYCGSSNTVLKNRFGSALCRSIHVCQACNQPFESFKPL